MDQEKIVDKIEKDFDEYCEKRDKALSNHDIVDEAWYESKLQALARIWLYIKTGKEEQRS